MSDHPAATYRSKSLLAESARENKLRFILANDLDIPDGLFAPLPAAKRLQDLPVEMHGEIMSWTIFSWARKLPSEIDIHTITAPDFEEIFHPARACRELFSAIIREAMAPIHGLAVFNLEDRMRYAERLDLNLWFGDVFCGVRAGLRNLTVEVQLGGFYGHVFVPKENEQQTNNAVEMLARLKEQFSKLKKLKLVIVNPIKDGRTGFPDLRPYFSPGDYRTETEAMMTSSLVRIVEMSQKMAVDRVEIALERDNDETKGEFDVVGKQAASIVRVMEDERIAGRVFVLRGGNDDDI